MARLERRLPYRTLCQYSFVFLFFSTQYVLAEADKRNLDIHPGWWDRDTCMSGILDLLDQSRISPNDASLFRQDFPGGPLYNSIENMTVTPEGCLRHCGPHTMYWDWLPRLTTWIVPVVLLLTNIELSPIDKKRFMTVIHAIGDPIDSFWSIIHKIYIWRRLYRIGYSYSQTWEHPNITRVERARIIATVLSGFEEIAGSKIENELYYLMVCRRCGIRVNPRDEDSAKFDEWRRTARILADARTYEFIRTFFAMLVYVFAVISALVPAIGGGNTSPPGGRIGSAIYLSWLIPLALLSSRVGNFTSPRSCLTILREFVRRASDEAATNPNGHAFRDGNAAQNLAAAPGQPGRTPEIDPIPQHLQLTHALSLFPFQNYRRGDNMVLEERKGLTPQQPIDVLPEDDVEPLIPHGDWDHYFESLHWLGAIYIYRPWKVIYLDVDHRTHAHRSNVMMVLTGIIPVTVSTVSAFLIIWYAVPVGFGCRHIWVIGLYVLWLASAAFTSIIYYVYKDKWIEHTMWIVAFVKDGIVGAVVLVTIVASTSGIFNFCWCWGLANRVAVGIGYVPVASDDQYNADARNQYLIIVCVCLGAQFLFFIGLILRWKDSMHLVRWKERQRRRQWTHEWDEGVEYTPENKFLFWHKRSELLFEEMRRQNRRETFQNENSRPRRWSLWNNR